MQYPDKWVFQYDDETLRANLDEIDYNKYMGKGEVPMSNWKSIDLSFQEFEKIIQKHLVSQVQILLTFFNTEAVCSDYKSFQDFSNQMINFLKSEMLYCYSFWKFANIKDFVRQRLNASLVRTYRFLMLLQINTLDKYMRERDVFDNAFELNPHKECLNNYIEDMLVEYSQIKTIMAFFEKGYGELYEKLQRFNSLYPNDIEMIAKIYLFSKLFFEVNPRGMHVVLKKALSKDPERPVLIAIFKANDDLKFKIEEKAKGLKKADEENQIENYFMKQMMSSYVVKKVEEEVRDGIKKRAENELKIIEETKPQVQEKPKIVKKSFVAERLKTVVTEPEEEESPREEEPVLQLTRSRKPTVTSRSDPKSPDGKKKNILKGLGKYIGLTHQTSNVSDIEAMSPAQVKEKEPTSVADILMKTANNPFQNHPTNPLLSSIRSESTGPTMSTALASTLSLTTFKHATDGAYYSPEKLSTSRSREESTYSQKASSKVESERDKKKEALNEYHEFLSEALTDGLITAMIESKLEPAKLRMREEQNEEEMRRRQTVKFMRSTTRFFTKVENKDNSDDMISTTDGPSSPMKRDRSKSRKKDIEIEFNPAILEETEQKHITYRENRGQDVADEKILGNLIGKVFFTFELILLDDNISDNQEEEEDPELIDFKKDNLNIVIANRFVNKVKALVESQALPATHFRPAKNILDLKHHSDICSVRSTHKWSVVHDNLRAAICQKQIFKIRHEEDPMAGLSIVPRHMKYLIRKSQRNNASDVSMNFNSLYD